MINDETVRREEPVIFVGSGPHQSSSPSSTEQPSIISSSSHLPCSICLLGNNYGTAPTALSPAAVGKTAMNWMWWMTLTGSGGSGQGEMAATWMISGRAKERRGSITAA